MKRTALLLASLLAGPMPLAAQHDHSPYAGREAAEGTTLTPEEVQGLRAGDGMSLALPAELNGYPGPKHVLELADDLDLSAEQAERVREIFTDMQQAAMAVGEEIINAERHLAGAFRAGNATKDQIDRITGHLAEMRGRLRSIHLVAHIETTEALTSEQVSAYGRIRGYHAGH